MRVRYIGTKEQVPVTLPIGEKRKSAIAETLFAAPVVELSDEDAKLLVEIDPRNFAFDDAPQVEGEDVYGPKQVKAKKPAKRKRAKRRV